MPLFSVFALMTAVAALAVLWPLSRARVLKGAREADLAVYRDQLAEIARDKESGRLPAEQAEAARIEVARRMLAADAAREVDEGSGAAAVGRATFRRRAAAVVALVLIPVGAAGLYAYVGSPDVPDAPLAERLSAPADRGDIAILVRRVEEHLAAHPDDGKGYEVLAPIYLRLGRPQDAARAYFEAIRTLGPSPERYSALGEALVVASSGVVSADAQEAFKAALALDPSEPRAQYFSGLAAEQDGRPQDAATIFRQMIKDAPKDAPYVPVVEEALARALQQAPSGPAAASAGGAGAPGVPQGVAAAQPPAEAQAPGPSAADVAAAAAMSAEDRAGMIRSMVARLETRLKDEPNDLDGWLRLVRAFTVLGEKEKAEDALQSARDAFKDNAEALARIDAAARDLKAGG